jgi:type I restriction enzyme S subunit
MVATDERMVMVRSVALVRPAAQLDPLYLEYFLRSKPIQREIAKVARSSAQANLFQGPLRNLPLILPEQGPQKAFALIVQQGRQLLERQDAHLAKLDELFASLQHRAFNGTL